MLKPYALTVPRTYTAAVLAMSGRGKGGKGLGKGLGKGGAKRHHKEQSYNCLEVVTTTNAQGNEAITCVVSRAPASEVPSVEVMFRPTRGLLAANDGNTQNNGVEGSLNYDPAYTGHHAGMMTNGVNHAFSGAFILLAVLISLLFTIFKG